MLLPQSIDVTMLKLFNEEAELIANVKRIRFLVNMVMEGPEGELVALIWNNFLSFKWIF